ncbi:uncharacterized protein TRAVEDRAFT_75594 [Trametes versicolor FP-101664 SS1]|uniref:Uncharacterized protein n=2 Tax=Trametes versicolor (strain FP-101664) TaxID=717944 RepID=R7SA42_TRAVS|nr:uncharacterized protein TRAVEDRAFT_75594 [Trametes versicolor FP-101664 SS1]EIW51829.1 hypothetical protein TRAVEDRAFT_75594 [Trametes versicolor FP-101664 SS1]
MRLRAPLQDAYGAANTVLGLRFSAVPYGSYSNSFSSSSPASQPDDFPFTPYTSFSLLHFTHQPMRPLSEDSLMYFHPQGMRNDDTDALFAAYLDPPMAPQDDSPMCGGVQQPVKSPPLCARAASSWPLAACTWWLQISATAPHGATASNMCCHR